MDLYLHLARASEEQRKPLQRDKFLVLAAFAAMEAGYRRVAEECRKRLLSDNPNHILRNYASMQAAYDAEEIQHYANQLLRIYPFEKAEYLLEKYRASGYSSGHGYGEIAPLSGMESDAGSGQKAFSAFSARPSGLDAEADSWEEHDVAGSDGEFDFSDWPEPQKAPAPSSDVIPVRIVHSWIILAAGAGIAIGAALLAFIQHLLD